MDGKKLSECTSDEIKEITPIAQEAFLVQLFEAGLLHADPHPVRSSNYLRYRRKWWTFIRSVHLLCFLFAHFT
jgi:hypothetical protein